VTNRVLPTRTSIAVIGILVLDSVVNAIKGHALCGCSQDGTTDNGGERVAGFGVAVSETTQIIGAARMGGVNFGG